MSEIGQFERAARTRIVRDKLWRAVMVQHHAYDEWRSLLPDADEPGGVAKMMRDQKLRAASERGDWLFEKAVALQDSAREEAERLGFRLHSGWLDKEAWE